MTKVVHYSAVPTVPFEGATVHNVLGRLLVGKEDGAEIFFMRMFELAEGGYTPHHTHDWEHQAFVHTGVGTLLKDGEWVAIKAGDVVHVPSNTEHQFKNAGTEPLRFLCLIPNKGQPEL